MDQHARVAIIGSGPAGYTAAIYAARAMLNPILIEGSQGGGQLSTTTDVENFPGFADVVQGPWLMEQMKAQALHVGARLVSDEITAVEIGERPFRLHGVQGAYSADAVIICTGAQAKWLGLPDETEYRGFGVSSCATCDGFFYRDQTVLMVGGGNTAVEEALYMTNIAAKVILAHRRDSLRADKVLQARLFANPKVEILWNTALVGIEGDPVAKSVRAARLADVGTGETRLLAVDGIFVTIGHTPATNLFAGKLDLSPTGYIRTQAGTTRTSVPGVFAAGDVMDERYRQAVTAAGTGCMAALDAEQWLMESAA